MNFSLISRLLAVAGFAAVGTGAVAAYEVAQVPDGQISIQLVEFNPAFYSGIDDNIYLQIDNPFEFIAASQDKLDDFIVAGGHLFFGVEGGNANHLVVTRIDGVRHNVGQDPQGALVLVGGDGVDVADCYNSYLYLGADSYGNPYMSARTSSAAGEAVALVYPLSISADGAAIRPTARYELPLGGLYPRKIFVSGNVADGNFTATAMLREKSNPPFNSTFTSGNTHIGQWTVAGGTVTTNTTAPLRHTYAMISYPDGGERFLLDDNGRYADDGSWSFVSADAEGYVSATPSLCRIDGSELVVDAELPDVPEGVYDAGTTTFTIGGHQLVVYSVSADKPRYNVALLGDGLSRAASAPVTRLWTLNDNFADRVKETTDASHWNHNNTRTFALPSDDGRQVDLYISSNHTSMAHYRLTYDGTWTSIAAPVAGEASETAAEYYDLAGRRVASPASGFYIERRGAIVRKVLIR